MFLGLVDGFLSRKNTALEKGDEKEEIRFHGHHARPLWVGGKFQVGNSSIFRLVTINMEGQGDC